jgi:peptide deformylase
MIITDPIRKPKFLPIAMKGAPVLRKQAALYQQIDDEARRLAHDMIATMREAGGIGLAANQVGVAKRLIVIDVTGAKDQASAMFTGLDPVDIDSRMPMILFNPEIQLSGPQVLKTEGCLSQPGVAGPVSRYLQVNVTHWDLFGNECKFSARGMLARVIQHEVDHLNGILFTDRLEGPSKTQ